MDVCALMIANISCRHVPRQSLLINASAILIINSQVLPEFRLLGLPPILTFVAAVFTISLAPYTVLTAHMLRLATVAKKTILAAPSSLRSRSRRRSRASERITDGTRPRSHNVCCDYLPVRSRALPRSTPKRLTTDIIRGHPVSSNFGTCAK